MYSDQDKAAMGLCDWWCMHILIGSTLGGGGRFGGTRGGKREGVGMGEEGMRIAREEAMPG